MKIKTIVDELKSKNQISDYMMECVRNSKKIAHWKPSSQKFISQKINERIFSDLKLTKGNEIDLAAVSKYIDSALSGADWKLIYQTTAKKCLQDISANLTSIVAKFEAGPFNLKRDLCNVKFMAVMTCVQIHTFIVNNLFTALYF